jgi:hypothetical protein
MASPPVAAAAPEAPVDKVDKVGDAPASTQPEAGETAAKKSTGKKKQRKRKSN